MDYIVTNKKVKKEGKIISLDSFLEMAQEGIDLSGDLYIDIDGLDIETYEAIKDALSETIFFTTEKNKTSHPFVSEFIFIEVVGNIFSKSAFAENEIDESSVDERKIKNLIKSEIEDTNAKENQNSRVAKVFLFGSSKGGTGKTFTCLISAYRYAKLNPNKKVAVADFDIIDGQVGISIHKVSPTMLNFYNQYKRKLMNYEVMQAYKVKSDNFPSNMDFYLSPKDYPINDTDFWDLCYYNLITNYDAVFFDSGIDYLNYPAISNLYKIADKILLISTTSIKSVASVRKQIEKLRGDIQNPVFEKSDNIGPKLNLVITQAFKDDMMNDMIHETFGNIVNIVGAFGYLTPDIQKAEFSGKWNVFDNNRKFNDLVDKIIDMD